MVGFNEIGVLVLLGWFDLDEHVVCWLVRIDVDTVGVEIERARVVHRVHRVRARRVGSQVVFNVHLQCSTLTKNVGWMQQQFNIMLGYGYVRCS